MSQRKPVTSVHFYADTNDVSVWRNGSPRSYEGVSVSSRHRLVNLVTEMSFGGLARVRPSVFGWYVCVDGGND